MPHIFLPFRVLREALCFFCFSSISTFIFRLILISSSPLIFLCCYVTADYSDRASCGLLGLFARHPASDGAHHVHRDSGVCVDRGLLGV